MAEPDCIGVWAPVRQVELRARRLLSELERNHTAPFTSSADAEQRAREETEKMLLICAVSVACSRR